MFMWHIHSAWMDMHHRDTNMEHGHETWAATLVFRMDMQNRHAWWISSIDKLDGRASWTLSICRHAAWYTDNEHAAWSCSMTWTSSMDINMQRGHGHAAWGRTFSMDMYMQHWHTTSIDMDMQHLIIKWKDDLGWAVKFVVNNVFYVATNTIPISPFRFNIEWGFETIVYWTCLTLR